MSTPLERRLQTLSSAHDILFRQNWQAAPLNTVIASSLQMIGMNDRVVQTGPRVEIGPRATLATSLLIHELATNAAKYGALSSDSARC